MTSAAATSAGATSAGATSSPQALPISGSVAWPSRAVALARGHRKAQSNGGSTTPAGAGRITFEVAGLDALLGRLAAQRIEHEPIETYSSGVRHVKIPDPDGNAIAFAEPPDAAST
jgi:hypothetical protein